MRDEIPTSVVERWDPDFIEIDPSESDASRDSDEDWEKGSSDESSSEESVKGNSFGKERVNCARLRTTSAGQMAFLLLIIYSSPGFKTKATHIPCGVRC
jgi:hypothetical protein